MKMYWGKPMRGRIKEPIPYTLALILAVIALAVFGIYPQPIYDFAYSAAGALGGF
jgi:NADH:ubiquinone oxidoreductase subunit 2 (subunit N)